jgi:WD40 repeat protein
MSFSTSVVFLAATTCFAIAAPAADDTKPSDGPSFCGKLVLFGAQREPRTPGTVEILTMNPDGTGVESLLKLDDVGRMSGRVSPDGRRIAFGTSRRDGKGRETWILEANGSRRKVSVDGMIRAWSPDGKSLACFRHAGADGWESLRIEVESGRVHTMPVPPSDLIEDWSSRGETLSVMAGNREHVFEHPGKGTYPLRQIDLMAPDGSRRGRITKDPLLDNIWSRFSPDGSLVAHQQRRHVKDKVFEYYVVCGRDGGHPVEVIRGDKLDEELHVVESYPSYPYHWFPNSAPCWSPDGSRIVACLNNAKWAHGRADKMRFALVFATPEGRFERALDLKKLGIVFVCEIDWK